MIDEPETEIPLTDLERFIELYRSFGIECIVNTSIYDNQKVVLFSTTGHDTPHSFGGFVNFISSCSDKVEVGSLEFIFSLNGKFIGMAGSEIE